MIIAESIARKTDINDLTNGKANGNIMNVNKHDSWGLGYRQWRKQREANLHMLEADARYKHYGRSHIIAHRPRTNVADA